VDECKPLDLGAVPMDIIPFERDVFSIEHETCYRDLVGRCWSTLSNPH
jgi:hypothetical protein